MSTYSSSEGASNPPNIPPVIISTRNRNDGRFPDQAPTTSSRPIPAQDEQAVPLPSGGVNSLWKNGGVPAYIPSDRCMRDLEAAYEHARKELPLANSRLLSAQTDRDRDQKAMDEEARERQAAIADEEQRLQLFREQESAHAAELNQAIGELEKLEAVNNLSKAKTDRTLKRTSKVINMIANESDPIKRARQEARSDASQRRDSKAKKGLDQEANRPIVWKSERILAGIRQLPTGAFACPVASTLGPAYLLGATGGMDCVPFENGHEEAIRLATAIFVAQTPPHAGHPHHRHVGHMVLSLPLTNGIPFTWSQESGVRAARLALWSQGADPDQHDMLIFLHRQRKSNGDHHDEECIHILWSRVRHDGWILTTPFALASAHLGCARWNVAAGFDALRLGVCSMKSFPVRHGYEDLNDGKLEAHYGHADFDQVVTVALQSDDFRLRMGNEGKPALGECAGVWIPKPGYREEDEIKSMLRHLYTAG